MELEKFNSLYLLRNNTFQNIQANMTNTSYKILSFILMKEQFTILKKYNGINSDNIDTIIKDLGGVININISKQELRSLNIDEKLLKGKGLDRILDELNNTQVQFVSYLKGNRIKTHLVSKFEINLKTGNITAVMFPEVFMYLLDYKLKLKSKAEIQESKLLKTGYTKLNLDTVIKFKSYYTQVFFTLFKIAYEQTRAYNSYVRSFKKKYSVDYLRAMLLNETTEVDSKNKEDNKSNEDSEKQGTLKKYKLYTDFRKATIEKAIQELGKLEIFDIKYLEIKNTVNGRKKITEVEFQITIGDKYSTLVEFNEIEPNAKDVEFTEVKSENISPASISLTMYEKAGIKIATSTIEGFIRDFGLAYTKATVNTTINRAKDKTKPKLTAPVRYMQTVLNDLVVKEKRKENTDTSIEQVQRNYTSNNSKRLKQLKANGLDVMGFNNVEPRNYDYDKLENKLLYGNSDDESEDEYLYDLYNPKKEN